MAALSGRTAVVTGAGRGIGRAIALTLAAEGAAVVLAGRTVPALEDTARAVEDKGGRALVAPADVTVASDLERVADTALDAFGAIDVLVANSGVAGPSAPLWELDQAEWDATMAVNVTGVFLSCRAVLPSMIERRSGAIVVIGSMTGKRPLVQRTPYAASKTALIGLVRTVAAEAGEHGVRVNLVSPGAVQGERIEWVIRAQAEARGVSLDEARAAFTSSSVLKRLVTPEEVAEAVAFLASDRAVAITGEDLNVSAGTVMY
jgi:NAD(P)-dependent dehydrogenase (short-subunit alcohol dehydrogenase family)